ncbi:DUF3857 domain-containing protein [Algoriphagus sp. C2-6-M1]|uniref:DUF3857 domain-containing protein n=1 Tax=Algoriphagus persicinus TaxID=3108754 RepID=UPI002B3D847B|nr:DUF3857 domain-containing protein [Algoriphagus sp. C2-6-M1]MEB2778958.1 DUF3857 domain-containing protein [Algoriphagus sp. C2-6-M1]
MNSTFLMLALLFLSFSVFSQTAKLGQANQMEINLSEVPFEPDAPAVLLMTQGESKFFGNVFETTYFVRMKILAEAGKQYGDVRIRYYVGDKRYEEISGLKAQTVNYQDGKAEEVKVEKEGIFDVAVRDGYQEVRISFPSIQVGSIIEYTYKKTDKNITFIDGWTFQNNIPTLFSKYQITMTPYLQYRTIGQGINYAAKVEKADSNGTYSWTLRNQYSLKEEPFMKNYRDYVDRIEFQLTQYQVRSSTAGVEWEKVMNTWEELGDDMISYYTEKGFYRSNPIEKEALTIDLSGASQKEKAEKAYYFLRDNYVIKGEDWIYPKQTLNQLLKSKVGTPVELMLTLMGILKSMGIKCDPVLIGSKGYGRSELVQYPFLNQFDEVLLLTELDGSLQFLDLTDLMAPFGYVDLDKHVAGGLFLQKEKSKLIPIDIRHNSNTVYFSQVSVNDSGELWRQSSYRNYFYKGLEMAHVVDTKRRKSESLDKLFKEEDHTEISNFKIDDALQEKNFYTVNYEVTYPESANSDMILFRPMRFSSFSENPFSEEFRMFPVDFEYAFSETYNTNVLIPEGYEIDDYPLQESFTIDGGYVTFMYSPTMMDNMLKITARVEVKIPLIPAEHYEKLKYFMESVASKFSEPVILKKKSNP